VIPDTQNFLARDLSREGLGVRGLDELEAAEVRMREQLEARFRTIID
jgi:hypothetical protein